MNDALQSIVAILSEAPMCFLGTVSDGKPYVWPFQFQFEKCGKLWFCTAKSKDVYKHMERNPCIEICAVKPDTTTLRLSGKALLEDNREIKERILTEQPLIRNIYGTADNLGFTSFCLEHGSYVIFDLCGNPPRKGTI